MTTGERGLSERLSTAVGAGLGPVAAALLSAWLALQGQAGELRARVEEIGRRVDRIETAIERRLDGIADLIRGGRP